MAKTWIVTKNLWRYATLTASSENPEFPANFTKDDSPQLHWRSVAAALTPNIVADMGSVMSVNFISIRGHNLSGVAGCTATLKGADDAGITTNVTTDALTFYGNNLSFKLAATRAKRYFQILFSDTTNPANYIKASTIVLGFAVSLGRQYTIGSGSGYGDESEQQKTPSGYEALVQAHAMPSIRNLKWMGLSDAVAAYIYARDLECGTTKAFLICLDTDNPNTSTLWVKTPTLNLLLREGPNNHLWEPGELREVL